MLFLFAFELQCKVDHPCDQFASICFFFPKQFPGKFAKTERRNYSWEATTRMCFEELRDF